MTFIEDITGRFLINVDKIDYIERKPDGSVYVVVRNRSFEVADNVLEVLRETLEREYE